MAQADIQYALPGGSYPRFNRDDISPGSIRSTFGQLVRQEELSAVARNARIYDPDPVQLPNHRRFLTNAETREPELEPEPEEWLDKGTAVFQARQPVMSCLQPTLPCLPP
jgi:hypothetical protein